MLTAGEAARRINATERTVRRWIADGHLPATKAGGSWQIDEAVLDEVAASRRFGPRKPTPASEDLMRRVVTEADRMDDLHVRGGDYAAVPVGLIVEVAEHLGVPSWVVEARLT